MSVAALEGAEEQGIREWMLAKFEHPFEIDIKYMDELPRGRTGKLQDFISEVDERIR